MQELDLLDYRRRVAAIYAQVRRRGPGEDTWQWWRDARDELFASHPMSPLPVERRAGFEGLPYFPYDADLQMEATVQPAEPQVLTLAHSAAGDTPARRFGRVQTRLKGQEVTLSLYWLDIYGGGVFLPFRDATAGAETYGGGRYLLDTAKSADLGGQGRHLVLDWNFAYHPSCVHDPLWSCPLAPPDNQLAVPVHAGERLP